MINNLKSILKLHSLSVKTLTAPPVRGSDTLEKDVSAFIDSMPRLFEEINYMAKKLSDSGVENVGVRVEVL